MYGNRKLQEKETDPDQEMDELEQRIEKTRIQYELYFNGIRPREPAQMRQDLMNRLARLRRQKFRQTRQRFRMEGIASRIAVLNRYWNRIMRAKEEGTFHRDRLKAQKIMQKKASDFPTLRLRGEADEPEPKKDETPVYSLEDLEKADLGASKKKEIKEAAAKRGAAKRAAAGESSFSEERIKQIHKSFVRAKQKCNESTDNLSVAAVTRTIQKQLPKLKAKGYHNIDFKVVIKDGKAALRAVGKKKS